MTNWAGATDDILAWARAFRPASELPSRVELGERAHELLRYALDTGQGVLDRPEGMTASLMMLSGLPLLTRKDFPTNLWVIMDGFGRAIQAGAIILPEMKQERERA